MDTSTIVIVVLLGLIFTLIPFVFRAGSEGRLRRGAGWYLDVSGEPLDSGVRERERRSAMLPSRTEGAPTRNIVLWIIGGVGDLVLAGVLWSRSAGWIFPLIVTGIGLALLGMAVEAWRGNRYLAGDSAVRAVDLLEGADRAEADASRMAAAGERVKARELLMRAADDLRAYAPGSGRPDEILSRARSLREAAERL